MEITTKYIEDRLREYKENCSTIETTLARIEVYKKAIGNPDSFREIYTGSTKDIGMPTGKGGKPSSPTETSILNTEDNREEIIETLKEWIKEDQSRIYPLQIEKEQVDGALNALTEQQKHIVKCKYSEGMFWREIEDDFNNNFGKKHYITVEGLRKLNRQALETIVKVLRIYYERSTITVK